MRYLAYGGPGGLLLLLLALLPAEADAEPEPPAAPDPRLASIRNQINPEFQVWSRNEVVHRVAGHLLSTQRMLAAQLLAQGTDPKEAGYLAAQEVGYLRYFDASEVYRAELPALTAALFYAVNSSSSGPVTIRPRPLPGSDDRLFWFDLRWYCWSPEAFEKVSLEDPYFREPLVSSGLPELHFVKGLIGNGIVRADWFNYYVGDTSLFLKVGQVRADNAFYYLLLYSHAYREVEAVELEEVGHWRDRLGKAFPAGRYNAQTAAAHGLRWVAVRKEYVRRKRKRPAGVPQNLAEFEAFWGVDSKLASDRHVDRGAVVDEGESYVSFQNRVLRRLQSVTGVEWITYDVFRTAGNQDFVEALPVPPEQFDAGEVIFQDIKGAQFYFLTDGNDKRLEFGDPRVVRDTMSGGKLAVVTFKSCTACHTTGIIPFRNEIPLLIKAGAELKARGHFSAQALQAFYLSSIDRLVRNDQEAYADFVRDCNGLTGEENASQFRKARDTYAAPLTLDRAAREVGAVATQEFMDAVQIGTKGRIGRLILDGKAIPRTVWEFGGDSESFLLLKTYRRAAGVEK